MNEEFNHQMSVNCDKEYEAFENILRCTTKRRIITIKAESGRGKTQLIHRYEHYCKTSNSPIPVGFIDLKSTSSIFEFSEKIVRCLDSKINFPSLKKAKVAKDLERYNELEDMYARIESQSNIHPSSQKSDGNEFQIGTVDLKDANLSNSSGNIYIGLQNNYYQLEKPDEDKIDVIYKKIYVAYFLKDIETYLNQVSSKRKASIVLLFDEYQKANNEIKDWLKEKFFPLILNSKKPVYKLIIVIAGQEVPNFEMEFSAKWCQERVHQISLSQWSRDDVIKFAEKHEISITHIESYIDSLVQTTPFDIKLLFERLRKVLVNNVR